MKKLSIAIGSVWLVFPIFFAVASTAYAAQCLDKSPTIVAGKSPIGPITIRELTDTEYQQVKALFKSLDGHWQGSSTEVECNLANIEDQEIDHYTIKAKVKSDRSGNIVMNMEFYSAEERTRHQKTLRFYLYEKFLRIHHDNGAGDAELIEVSESKIELRYRVFARNLGNRGGIHRELFYRLAANTDGFTIIMEAYIHGRLNDKVDWRFHKR